MTISHHPRTETLVRYAAGRLAPGPAAVLAAHLDGCVACRKTAADLEAMGGVLLADMPPTPLAPEALARTLAQLDDEEAEPLSEPLLRRTLPPPRLGDIVLPEALRDCEIGPWRWLAPGMRWSKVRLPQAPDASIMLLRVGPTRKLPQHGHTGVELTQILSGSFADSRGRYGPGDVMEADDEIHHQPVVDAEGECICLIAVEGRMRMHGLIARLLQPFIGF